MRTLIIDTSTERGLVALADGAKILFEKALPSSRALFSSLPSLDSLEAIAVTLGPGSFTGIRVALAAAHGLAYGRKLPLLPLCSLAGFLSPDEGRFASVIDARLGGAYVMIQERRGNEIIQLSEPQKMPISELPDLPLFGPNVKRFGRGTVVAPSAAHLATLAAKAAPAQDLVPMYS